LLKQGARLVESVDDLIEELGLQSYVGRVDVAEGNQLSLTSLQVKLLALMGVEAEPFDLLQAKSMLPPGTLKSELLQLELLGKVVALPGQNYIRM
jgi:DNA processing protein